MDDLLDMLGEIPNLILGVLGEMLEGVLNAIERLFYDRPGR